MEAALPTAAPPPVVIPERVKLSPRRRRWQNRLLFAFAVVVLLAGFGLLGGSYFYDSIREPGQLSLVNSTEVFAVDGTTQLALLGAQHRRSVPLEKIPEQAQKALIAGEDKRFYEHDGVDLAGIARAAWNNITGGETQGGSTITQQYARVAAGDLEISYARKLREAVMARKLENNYTKEQILSFYLNTVYFGRGAHGVGAAVEAYFGIPADQIDKLTAAQAAVLGAVLKQPEGKNGFDPAVNLGNAKGRWGYVLDNMVEMKWLSPQERSSMQYPEFKPIDAGAGGAWGHNDRATGHIIKYIEDELEARGIRQALREQGLGDWKNAGLRITTTIDPRAQAALEAQLDRAKQGSPMSEQRDNIIGAGVAIDPSNGRVIAYYGGSNRGTDTDWASDAEPHPPASSFKPYTLAAALQEGISTQSLWDATEMKKGVNGAEFDIANAGREIDSLPCGTRCKLETLTVQSFNVAFFKVAKAIGSEKVVTMAHNAGVRTMWSDNPQKAYHLEEGIPGGRTVFDYHVGFGQYPISVLDHASGMATLANHGVHHEPHFVVKVERKNRQTGQWEPMPAGDEKAEGRPTIDAKVADEVTWVLKKIPEEQDHTLQNGRQVASKSGTWENGKHLGTHAHAWYVGYTEQIASVVWVGSKDHNETPIKDPKGRDIFGSGLPGTMWEAFMNQAHADMQLEVRKMTDGMAGKLGDPNKGEFKISSPPPSRATPSSPKPDPTPNSPTPRPKPTITTPPPNPSRTPDR